jgi:hypothetical protein
MVSLREVSARRKAAAPRPHRGTKANEVGANGRELLSRTQTARELAIAEKTLRLWHDKGVFVPALRRRGVWLYTREQVEEHRTQMPGELAALAFRAFEAGHSAVETVIALRANPGVIRALHTSYLEMSSAWVIAGPAGSRASWEATYRLGKLTAEKLRCALELCGTHPELRAKLLAAELPKEPPERERVLPSAPELAGDAIKELAELPEL